MAEAIRIGIVDIYPLFRVGVVEAVKRANNVTVAAEGASAEDAERMVRRCDVLLMEAAVPGSIGAAKAILEKSPATKVVFLSAAQDDEHARQALQLGVHGYLLKQVSGTDLVRAVVSIHEGGRQIASEVAWRLLTQANAVAPAAPKQLGGLSIRERQVLDHTTKGLTNAQMASLLSLSISTIKRYKTKLFKRLGVRNRVEAIASIDGGKPK